VADRDIQHGVTGALQHGRDEPERWRLQQATGTVRFSGLTGTAATGRDRLALGMHQGGAPDGRVVQKEPDMRGQCDRGTDRRGARDGTDHAKTSPWHSSPLLTSPT
jgi:hypothetical protein